MIKYLDDVGIKHLVGKLDERYVNSSSSVERPTYNGKGIALTSDLSDYLPLAGGKMTGDINLGTTGGLSGTTAYGGIFDVFKLLSSTKLQVGGTLPELLLRGKNTRPTYNGSEMSLMSDLSDYLKKDDASNTYITKDKLFGSAIMIEEDEHISGDFFATNQKLDKVLQNLDDSLGTIAEKLNDVPDDINDRLSKCVNTSDNQTIAGNKVFTGTTSTMTLHTYNPLYVNNGTDNSKNTSLYTDTDGVFKIVNSSSSVKRPTYNGNEMALISDLDEIANIQIDGRNLIAGTDGTTVYSGNNKDVWAGVTIKPPIGTEYIVSFDAKSDVAQTINCYFYSPNTTLSSESSTGEKRTGNIDGSSKVDITTEWKRYWVKWTQTPTDTVKSIIVGRVTTANNVYIRAVKLEEGNMPTAWTPAPEAIALMSDVNKKADGYSIEMWNATSGNPKPIKFITVDYSTCDANNGVAIKLGMVSGHGNGSSYAFLQDAIIKVNYTGATTIDNFKYYGASVGVWEGANRQYGDIFWVHNTDTKTVDFYVLMGQYAYLQMTPCKRVTYSIGGSITQYSSATSYDSGSKEWGNNSEFALVSDLDAKQDKCINNNNLYVGDDDLIGLNGSTIEVGNLDRNLVLETLEDRPQWTNDGETFKDLAITDDIENLQNQINANSKLELKSEIQRIGEYRYLIISIPYSDELLNEINNGKVSLKLYKQSNKKKTDSRNAYNKWVCPLKDFGAGSSFFGDSFDHSDTNFSVNLDMDTIPPSITVGEESNLLEITHTATYIKLTYNLSELALAMTYYRDDNTINHAEWEGGKYTDTKICGNQVVGRRMSSSDDVSGRVALRYKFRLFFETTQKYSEFTDTITILYTKGRTGPYIDVGMQIN